MKRADIIDNGTCETTGTSYCHDCSEYDICDNCGRRVCKYISVTVLDADREDDNELWCRYCAREHGYSKSEIESGRVCLC